MLGVLQQVQVTFPTAHAYIGHGERREMVEAVIQEINLNGGSATTIQRELEHKIGPGNKAKTNFVWAAAYR